MSTPNNPRRRRIAGERRRPEHEVDAREPQPAPMEQPKPPKTPKPPKAPRTGNPLPLFVGSAVVTVALVTTALVLGLVTWNFREIRESARVEEAGQAASASAERAATAILAYEYDNLDANLAGAQRFLTPDFSKEFTDTFNTFVRPNAPDQKATVTAKVLATAVISATPTHAEILVYVDQTTVSTVNPTPQVALNRASFDMLKRNGTWLVNTFRSY